MYTYKYVHTSIHISEVPSPRSIILVIRHIPDLREYVLLQAKHKCINGRHSQYEVYLRFLIAIRSMWRIVI